MLASPLIQNDQTTEASIIFMDIQNQKLIITQKKMEILWIYGKIMP